MLGCPTFNFGELPHFVNLIHISRIIVIKPSSYENYVTTSRIFLSGGIGTSSYGTAAENSWTGFYGSGEYKNLPGYAIPGLAGDLLVWVRDNTSTRSFLGNSEEVWGKVYFELSYWGLVLTGVSITNNSYEDIRITYVKTETYSIQGNSIMSIDVLYPYSTPSIHSFDYGVASPASESGIVNLTSAPIINGQYVIVKISVVSKSNRWGVSTCRITFP